ncbi:MAG: PAS domain S-box protein [Polyangiaceae bacterium]|nr:PAS domain S-box protein [Polyangiaceae bacterium]
MRSRRSSRSLETLRPPCMASGTSPKKKANSSLLRLGPRSAGRSEQKLADASNFLCDVIDAVPDPISVEGDDGKYVMVNRSFAELVGHARDEIVGCDVASMRPAVPGDGRWPDVSDEHEITWPAADGLMRSLSEKRAVLADRKGHNVLVSVMRDVTERKRYEAQLALTERLASLGTLAAGIAHEINNPLSYVIGNLAFAVDTLASDRACGDAAPQSSEIRNALSEALEGARRIAGIVRDVKMFSRADRETLKLVDPTSVVEASLRMVQSNIEGRARVVREISEVPRVLGNEARLSQVIVNLLMNAVQALPDRPAAENQITVALRCEHRAVVMEVRDNGAGISEESLRHVFDPFFTTKPVGEGMGLGLSICNSIINAHGGRIDVDSTVGIGTAFRVILPAASHLVNRPPSP